MKISRLKLLSILCYSIAIIFIFSYYIKYYNESNNLAYVEKKIDANKHNTKSTISDSEKEENVEIIDSKEEENDNATVEEIIEATPSEPEIVYDGKTLEELANQLDKSLASTIAGKGYLYASYSLERGVDPYLAVAISLEETGCTWGCSSLVVTCNNVGGMKGSGCGSYAAFPTIDEGIKAFIDNIANNYVAYGLTTAETMNPKYAENPLWASNVNAYITRIKNK